MLLLIPFKKRDGGDKAEHKTWDYYYCCVENSSLFFGFTCIVNNPGHGIIAGQNLDVKDGWNTCLVLVWPLDASSTGHQADMVLQAVTAVVDVLE